MELGRLPPADRIADTVYESLRNAIFTGTLQPGTRLSVPALAAELGVSRSPVREAVMRLTQERLAHEEPRHGALVAHIGPQKLAALYEVREVLEGLAARLTVENHGKDVVDQLAAALSDDERAVAIADVDSHVEADMRFHALLRRACGNAELVRMLDEIQTQVRLAMLTTSVVAGPQSAVRDHRTIFEAIASGNPDEAERAARAHIARLRIALREQAAVVKDAQQGVPG
jgi:DNA-binding GntR family transcriptional regulator